MVMFTVAWVALLTETEFTVIPAPKLATVVPLTKFVSWPVTLTSSVSACRPVDGATFEIDGRPAVTVNAFASVATSPSVVAVTVYAPSVACEPIDTFAVALVGLVTSSDVTVIFPPNETTVLPLAKCVFDPVIVTLRLSACRPVDGVT